MLSFLHLSDLHFTTKDAGTQFDQDNEIRDKLLKDLGSEDRTGFDAIFVTGDIAYHGATEEFERAEAWFQEVRQKTGVAEESFFVIPGNHDVNQKSVAKGSIMWDAHARLRSISSSADRDSELQKKLQDQSWDFLHPLSEYRTFAARQGRLSTTSAQELAWKCALPSTLDDGTPVFLHGLNSAFLSDAGDIKANLLVSPFQFKYLAEDHDGINLVMCHHPPSWLIDGNHLEDRFIAHAHVMLTGHEHQSRCFKFGDGLRICAGAVHPSRGEGEWNPGYNIIRMSIECSDSKRELVTEVETRVWHKTGFHFYHDQSLGKSRKDPHRYPLKQGSKPHPKITSIGVSTSPTIIAQANPVKESSNPDPTADFAAARRKLIIHFFRLGAVSRLQAAIESGVWEEADDAYDGQARWAKVFERAEQLGKMADLWAAVAAKDESIQNIDNPFKKEI